MALTVKMEDGREIGCERSKLSHYRTHVLVVSRTVTTRPLRPLICHPFIHSHGQSVTIYQGLVSGGTEPQAMRLLWGWGYLRQAVSHS